MIDAIVVWTGDKYSQLDVDFCLNQLLSQKIFQTIHCLSDKSPHRSDVNFIKVPDWKLSPAQQWWYKMCVFSQNLPLSNRCFYSDLDVLFTKSISGLVDSRKPFVTIRDFNRSRTNTPVGFNSSLMLWDRNKFFWLYTDFVSNKKSYMKRFRGDQDFITTCVYNIASTWPDEQVVSFKWEWMRSQKFSDPTAVVFHGDPKPNDFGYDNEKIRSYAIRSNNN